MKRSLEDIKKLRSKVMWEVAKMAWDGTLEKEVDNLPQKIKNDLALPDQEEPIIAQEINLSLGLDAKSSPDISFSERLPLAYREKGQVRPIVSSLTALCQSCSGEEICAKVCPTQAIRITSLGEKEVDENKCTACGWCTTACPSSALRDKVQFLPLVKLLQNKEQPVYAEVAPAIAGQFGENISMGQLRSAFKKLGFVDMIEVALLADILSIKEAYEFDHFVKEEKDFMLTSCCCPVWIGLIEKKFPNLISRVSPSVSPMIATGRVIKALHPESAVVFIGPCAAKKAEATLEDLQGAVDLVLTFKELETIFQAAQINLNDLNDDYLHQASWGGRAYGRTGGVSASIALILETIAPKRAIKVKSKRVDGTKACQRILQKAEDGELDVNFIEGMGCKGGCIGGPGRLVEDLFEGTHRINEYAYEAKMKIPLNNPDVYEVLTALGMNVKTPKVILTEPILNLLSRKINVTKKGRK